MSNHSSGVSAFEAVLIHCAVDAVSLPKNTRLNLPAWGIVLHLRKPILLHILEYQSKYITKLQDQWVRRDTMPPTRTCAARDQAADSPADIAGPTDTEADLDAEIDTELASLSEAADLLIIDSNTDLVLEDTLTDPFYSQLRQQTALDQDVLLVLLHSPEVAWSTESPTDSESTGSEAVTNHQNFQHQLYFLPSLGLRSPPCCHHLQPAPLSTQSLELITAQIDVLTAYLDPTAANPQLTPASIAQMYRTLSDEDAIRFCYFLREWGYWTNVRVIPGTRDGTVDGSVALSLILWDGQREQWAQWNYFLIDERPRCNSNW